ncbi:hypothetical protein K466DRAFT_163710 [Polyporus arcularius HHB13444]|uniref:Uncharacterized protein n=1 Tax=Polyporus arcularius HHB13444 TaxID=1314778 RepID=A0A5C3P8U3_9APHY|nr:hypothetical protein K466DRAFT_163710 [Polyporus arcularius HHB13444]
MHRRRAILQIHSPCRVHATVQCILRAHPESAYAVPPQVLCRSNGLIRSSHARHTLLPGQAHQEPMVARFWTVASPGSRRSMYSTGDIPLLVEKMTSARSDLVSSLKRALDIRLVSSIWKTRLSSGPAGKYIPSFKTSSTAWSTPSPAPSASFHN